MSDKDCHAKQKRGYAVCANGSLKAPCQERKASSLSAKSWLTPSQLLFDNRLQALLNIQRAPILRVFRHGVMLAMPLLLAAAIAILVNNFPWSPTSIS